MAAATGITAYAWLLVGLPLLGAAVLLLGGRATNAWGHLLATALSWAGVGSRGLTPAVAEETYHVTEAEGT